MVDYNSLTKEELISLIKADKYFSGSLQIGAEYQDLVMEELHKIGISVNCYTSAKYQLEKGESISGIEIKHDSKIVETGRIYFETHAMNREGKLIYNGVYKEDNAWLYAIGNETDIYIFSKAQVKQLCEKIEHDYNFNEDYAKVVKYTDKQSGKVTSLGVAIRVDYCLKRKLCIKHVKVERK